MKRFLKVVIAGGLVLAFAAGCASAGTMLKSEAVSAVPEKKFEKIIRLDTPECLPLQPDAGFVFVEPGGKVITDFPRQIAAASLYSLDRYERLNRDRMGAFVIKDRQGGVRGYYELLFEYRAFIWERGEEILLQISIPRGRRGTIADAGINAAGMGAISVGR
ncbi:MAG: hypothetical protein PHW80_03350 [Smithellaceae bacterium]|jgi:hypothetical protein|nr:hypothetical protein [Smithellaceae bacterium]MDD3259246.1 hypothetical protein [Smithellaceae bacterium]MDD3848317.1 hypothetical protein [Smithellaceae bacterium]HOG13089.1 hypothetical protein [Smithellaceae bacterium]HPL10123.1 hypothetical protein [Smithellaceae bacterium]